MTRTATQPATRVPRALADPPGWAKVALAALFYLAFSIYLTWPLVGDLENRLYGALGDLTGGIAYYRELAQDGLNPFAPGELGDFNAPAGYPVPWDLSVATVPSTATLTLLTHLFGAIPAMGLYTLAGYTLSGLAMFLLARRVTGNSWVALLAGWAFAFYPFAVINGQGHTDYIHGWALIPLVWRMLELGDRPTLRNGLLAGAAAILAFWWTPYFLLIGGVAFGALALAGLVRAATGRRLRAAIAPYAVACVIAGGFVLALLAITSGADATSVRAHTLHALFVYSARPFEYVVPPAVNPIFGDSTGPFLAEHIHGSNASESTLYIGVSLVLLALVALAAGVARRLEPRTRAVALSVAFMVVAGLAVSAPPKTQVFSETINLPSYYVYELTSTWRAFSRFVVLVMLGTTLLGSIGLAFLISRRKGALRVAILVAVAAIVAVDLWARLDGRVTDLRAPDVYAQLARQPDGIAVEYPLLPVGEGNYGDLFYQQWHGKPLLNGYGENTDEEKRALRLSDLARPSTASGLGAVGVDYVIDRVERPPGHPFAGGHPRAVPGLRRIGGDDYADLYEIRPAPGAIVTGLDGFDVPEGAPPDVHQWLVQRSGVLELLGSCDPCRGRLVFDAQSFAQERLLTVRDPTGRVLLRRRVSARQRLSVPIVFRRRARLDVRISPGPQAVAPIQGTEDPRIVGVQLFDARVVIDSKARG